MGLSLAPSLSTRIAAYGGRLDHTTPLPTGILLTLPQTAGGTRGRVTTEGRKEEVDPIISLTHYNDILTTRRGS